MLYWERQLEMLKTNSRSLEGATRFQDELLAESKLKNQEPDELKDMGLGLWDLKALRNLVNVVAIENGQQTHNGAAVVKTFISDIESHYPDYLRLRNRVSQLKTEESKYRTLTWTTWAGSILIPF